MNDPNLTRGSLHEDERGMLMITNLVAVMLCAMLMSLTLNVGVIVQRKVLLQNTADSVAYTGAVWQGRAMNALTTTNHVIGEMMGMVIVHHAVGGDELDESADDQASEENQQLELAYRMLMASGYSSSMTPAYDTVSAEVNAGAAVLISKATLKELLTQVYITKTAAWLMQQSGFPPVVAAGKALEAVMHVLELAILAEYEVLNVWEGAARMLVPVKLALRDVVLPETKRYADQIVQSAPDIIAAAASQIAEKNGMEGMLYPERPELPVEPDPFRDLTSLPPQEPLLPFPAMPPDVPNGGGVENLEVTIGGAAYEFNDVEERHYDGAANAMNADCNCPSVATDNMRHQIVKTTQLARATFPWVNYHREPIIDILKPLTPLSDAAKHYKEHTEKFSKELCDTFQTDWHQLWLYTLKGSRPPDKGFEVWNFPQYSDVADELFTVVGMVHLKTPPVLGLSTFGQPHEDGMAAYAQAMTYNANEQEQPAHLIDMDCKRIVPIVQANTGWDTLNWAPGSDEANSNCAAGDHSPQRSAEENRPFELIGARTNHHYPRVQVNWQAKLSPVTNTRHRQLVESGLPEPFAAIMHRLPTDLPSSLRTH